MPSTTAKHAVAKLTADQRKVIETLLGSPVTGDTVTLRVSSPTNVPRPCACGCGSDTKGGAWRPGHDQRIVARVLEGDETAVAIAAKHPNLQATVAKHQASRESAKAVKLMKLRGEPTPEAIVLNDTVVETPAEARRKARAS